MPDLKSTRGFLPFIAIVFLNAFVDLGHKIIIQNTIFKIYSGQEQIVLTAVVNGLILLPFIVLFSPAGFLADRFARQRIIRYSALAAVAATVLITASYYAGSFQAAFLLTLTLAVQSAIYSPAKYGYIKELVGQENLGGANGMVQAVTIAGILSGTFAFSLLFESLLPAEGVTNGGEALDAIAPLGWLLVGLAALEWWITRKLPAIREGVAGEPFRLRRYLGLKYLRGNLREVSANTAIWLSIVGLATFWAISQVLVASFPAFAKATLAVDNTVLIQGLLACSGVGIALGSMLAGRASRNYIELGLVPVGALGITLCLAVLPGLDSTWAMGGLFLVVGVMGGAVHRTPERPDPVPRQRGADRHHPGGQQLGPDSGHAGRAGDYRGRGPGGGRQHRPVCAPGPGGPGRHRLYGGQAAPFPGPVARHGPVPAPLPHRGGGL